MVHAQRAGVSKRDANSGIKVHQALTPANVRTVLKVFNGNGKRQPNLCLYQLTARDTLPAWDSGDTLFILF